MSRQLRHCLIAPKSASHDHEYCTRCDAYKEQPKWLFLYCSENCMEIFDTCSDYVFGEISADEANKRLEKCDLSDYENFTDEIKKNIKDIRTEVGNV